MASVLLHTLCRHGYTDLGIPKNSIVYLYMPAGKMYLVANAKGPSLKQAMKNTKSKTKKSRYSKYEIKNMIRKYVNKTRELKAKNYIVDEDTIVFASQGVINNNSGNGGYTYNYVAQGDENYQRDGNQIQPVSVRMKGWAKLDAESNESSYRESKLRLIWGLMDNDSLLKLQTSLSGAPIFWNGTEGVIPTNDFKDITRNLNYKFIRPVSDKTYSLAPNTIYYDSNGTAVTTTDSKMKDYFMIDFKYKFGKQAELTWDKTNNCWQKQNLVCIAFHRALNDDTQITSLNVEFCMEGSFYYFDS